jgi:hypothetical protein
VCMPGNESPVIACKPEKTSQIFKRCRNFPIDNLFYLFGVSLDSCASNYVPEVLNLWLAKGAFGELCFQGVCFEDF